MTGSNGETSVGRPPKPKHLRRTNRVVLLLTDDELEALDRHVEAEGFADRNDFARELLLKRVGYTRQATPARKPSKE